MCVCAVVARRTDLCVGVQYNMLAHCGLDLGCSRVLPSVYRSCSNESVQSCREGLELYLLLKMEVYLSNMMAYPSNMMLS